MPTETAFAETATSTVTPIPTETPSLAPTPTTEVNPSIIFDARDLVNDLAWSTDGRRLAVSAGNKIHLYAADTWTQMLVIPTHIWAARIAFHPTLPLIAAAMRDGTVRFWNFNDGQEVCSFTAHQKNAYSLAFRPDTLSGTSGKILGTTGNDIISRLWDISSLNDHKCDIREDYQLIANSYNSSDLTFAPSGDIFAVTDIQDIRVRENESHKLFRLLQTDDVIYDLAFSGDGAHLAAAQPRGVTRVWAVSDREAAPVILQDEDPSGFVWRVAFSTVRDVLATGTSAGRVVLWDFATQRVLTTYEHTNAVSALAFSPNGRWLASGGLDGVVHLWRIK